MIAVTRDEDSAHRRFRAHLKKYSGNEGVLCIRLKSSAAKKKSGSGQKKPERRKMTTLGEMLRIPENDIIHLFNNEAMLAVSHAIEDLASEQRQGELMATFQKMENFLPQKKRYTGLSRDLDAVRVWGEGKTPEGCKRIDFIPIFRPELLKYWIVLFASPKTSAVLVCRQVNQTGVFAKKIFAGFYSFNPFLVESIRHQLHLMSCGLDFAIRQWEKEYRFTSPPMEEINRYFKVPGGKQKEHRS